MAAITIRLPDKTLNELDTRAHSMNITRTDYIRKSIEHMNNSLYNNERRKHLMEVSQKVRDESMYINKEFNEIDHDPAS